MSLKTRLGRKIVGFYFKPHEIIIITFNIIVQDGDKFYKKTKTKEFKMIDTENYEVKEYIYDSFNDNLYHINSLNILKRLYIMEHKDFEELNKHEYKIISVRFARDIDLDKLP